MNQNSKREELQAAIKKAKMELAVQRNQLDIVCDEALIVQRKLDKKTQALADTHDEACRISERMGEICQEIESLLHEKQCLCIGFDFICDRLSFAFMNYDIIGKQKANRERIENELRMKIVKADLDRLHKELKANKRFRGWRKGVKVQRTKLCRRIGELWHRREAIEQAIDSCEMEVYRLEAEICNL